MKKKGFGSVRRNKRRTMQTGGGHTELITRILLGDYKGVEANIPTLQPTEKDAKAGPNRTFPFAQGRTALYLACRLPIPNPEIVKLLLDNGFSPNSRNNVDATLGNGAYPLHGVVEAIKVNNAESKSIDIEKSLEIIKLLKDRGANLEVKNSHGLTAYNEYGEYAITRSKRHSDAAYTELEPPPPRTIPAFGAARPPGPPPPPSGGPGQASFGSPPKITIQLTQSLTVISGHAWPLENKSSPPIYSLQNDTGINFKNAFVLCPTRIEEAFRSLLGNKCINMTLQYSQQRPITLPASIANFNGKHLQVLARNESVNTTGVMKTSLYGGVLTVKEIATIRCLVKNTTVVGITYPEKKGGYNGQYPPPQPIPIERKPTIIVDQCGLQWQNSIYNTGALFFYPTGPNDTVVFQGTDQTDKQLTHTTLGEYIKWQNDTYLAMYGVERPHVDLVADPVATWTANGQNIRGNLKSPVVGFKTEFMQAFDSVRFMADRTPSITNVHFKFLRAGLGFFSENIQLTNKINFLETARLQGICAGIRTLGGARAIMEHTKIKKIILPFQTVTIPDMGSFSDFLVTGKVYDPNNEDALAQNEDLNITIATTNCADPHAGPGNEGGYQSVDAAIASNAYVHHLNAAYNYANIQSKTFEEIGPVVPPVHVQPSAAYESPLLPGQVFHRPPSTAAAPPPAYPPPGGAAVYSPAAVDQTQNIMVQKEPGSAKWISVPQIKILWDIYLSDPTGVAVGLNHARPTDHIMITNTNKVMLRQWKAMEFLETGIMDVNDIKVYLIGPSLPQKPGQPPMKPGWYPASDYHKYAYLDFMYNTDQPQQSQGVTYLASQNSTNYSRRQPHHHLIKNFKGDIFNSDDLIVFTMIRLPDRRIYYEKNDLRRTLVFISGIKSERETYKLQMDQRLSEARQMWSNQPPAVPALPGSPLPPAPMAVAAPIRRTRYTSPLAPAGSPAFPGGLMADVAVVDYDRACVICQTNKPNLKFMPCAHCVCCISCYIENSNRLQCPLCRKPVVSLALCDEGGAEFQPPPPGAGYPPPPGAGYPPPPGAGQPPPPESPRGQPGCFGAACARFFPNFTQKMRSKHPNISRRLGFGGKNKNRKQQKQRATRKNKNKKQSRRRGSRKY